jgi:F0F1-type ATP synthase assembly protein I
MVKFVFPSGREGWINGVRGQIIGSKVWTETHVSSSGGGGYLHNGTGQVHAPTVTSTIIEKGETWVKTKNGKDVCVPLKIPGIEGHDVVTFWGNLKEISPKTGPYLYWKNFSAKKHSLVGDMDPRMSFSAKERSKALLVFMFISISFMLVGALLGATGDEYGSSAGMVGGGFLGFAVGFVIALKVALSIGKSEVPARENKLLEDLEQLSMRDDVEFNG